MHDHDALENERKRLQERYDEQPDSRVFAPLADCLRKLGKLQEALGVCHTGLSKHPRYSSAYVILGKIHLERGDDEAAREAFLRVLEFDPQNLLALRQLAELDEAREDFAAAVSRWELVTALEIDPAKAEERLEAARAKLDPPTGEDAEVPIGDSAEESIEAPATEPSDPPDDVLTDSVTEPDSEREAASTETAEAVEVAAVDDAPEELPVDEAKAATSDLAALEDDVDGEAASDVDADDGPIDHTLVGSVEDRSSEVAEAAPEVEGDATVPSGRALAPYVGSDLAASSDDLEDPVEAPSDVESEDLDPTAPAEDVTEPETEDEPVTTSAAIAADDAIPTTEIATMTLAEIYAEQGFRQKALDILRQVLERNPGADKVARRIEELETIAAEPASEADTDPGPDRGSEATGAQPAPPAENERPDLQADVERAIDPEPLTLTASETPTDPLEDGLDDGPEAEPAPPLTARTSPEAEEEDERERYGHFKNWLDRIRVDD